MNKVLVMIIMLVVSPFSSVISQELMKPLMDISTLEIFNPDQKTTTFELLPQPSLLPLVSKHDIMDRMFEQEFPGMDKDLSFRPFEGAPLNVPLSSRQIYIVRSSSGGTFMVINKMVPSYVEKKVPDMGPCASISGFDLMGIIYNLTHPEEARMKKRAYHNCQIITNYVY